MKRIIYSPKVYAFVKTDTGIYDLTPYITDCSINRKINAVSSASVTFRNPDRIFTNGENGPIFHPMDPIVIFMKRLKDRPVQIFTGYCDRTPYFQLKPGPATIEASCTLKRLLYTYWDPGLPFVAKVLSQRGWSLTAPDGGIALQNLGTATDPDNTTDGNPNATENRTNAVPEITDGSIGALLFDVLLYIGNWDPSTIYIENIPKGIYDTAKSLLVANNEAQDEVEAILKYLIGQSSFGSGDPSGGLANGPLGEKVADFAGENPGVILQGRVSYFDDGITASGVSAASNAGVALNLVPGTDSSGWNNEVTQQWMTWAREGRPMMVKVTSQGKSATMPIIDVGPNESTNRAIDITVTGVYKMGFRNLSEFKTDAQGTVEFLGRRN
jgi:hypothetical protein